ncbi:DUF2269 family protein [Aromatoleum buckelii]|uniref:DUF2269 family protein n=1 Tax=Aromatoleum buckelii TaxID=200254 RepID=A0ABX1N1V2_9RHOO|nr:DUF2269 domain-containing protein [Aromatoleum buckelii]MCK0512665.1 DUF2269 domain-containing protein [Aromatoleum buckelii]
MEYQYLIVKWVHILSSTVLFGTGIGSAFYLLRASLERDPLVAASVTRSVVVGDWLFTGTTVVLQPLTGFWLTALADVPLDSRWIAWSLVLYVLAVACWLPVVVIQIRLRDVAVEAAENARPLLPPRYWRLFRVWFALGVPAFLAFVGIFYLMVAKPI